MKYEILFTNRSRKQFSKLSKDAKEKIAGYLEKRVRGAPLKYGKALMGDKKGLWRYRVGDYRIICNISSKQLVILLVDIGHRKEVYKS